MRILAAIFGVALEKFIPTQSGFGRFICTIPLVSGKHTNFVSRMLRRSYPYIIRKEEGEDIISALEWQFNKNSRQITMSLLATQLIGDGWRNYAFIFFMALLSTDCYVGPMQ